MANHKDHLKGFLMRALDSARGIILTLSGGETGRRQAAIAALHGVKRELQPDVPELLDIQIKAMPNPDEIALYRVRGANTEDLDPDTP